ncbi:MAG: PAS domain-containing protein, partial [Planctomycetota bacterium]|nr:PAS domain-containing protein [Planctomycetota bacterium]
MTREAHSAAAVRPRDEEELDEAMQVFSRISESLLESYEALAERALRVDEELARTNLELENKVGELDGVKRHLEAVLRSLPTGVVVRDSGGRIVRVNDATVSILGVPAEELVGSRTHEALAGTHADGEPRELRRSDGTRLVLASRLSNVVDADGAVVGSVEILD